MCEAIDNPKTGTDIFARLYGAMNIYYNNSGTAKCFDPNSYGTDALGTDAWTWQVRNSNGTCSNLLLISNLIFFMVYVVYEPKQIKQNFYIDIILRQPLYCTS